MEMSEEERYLTIKKQLTDLGIDTFYCVRKIVWGYHYIVNKYGLRCTEREDHPTDTYYYTPLLCFLDNAFTPKNRVHEAGDDIFYEILNEFSSVREVVSIKDIISIKQMSYSPPIKSIIRMRKHAVKWGEKDQLEKLLLILIDKFSDIYLFRAILQAQDQDLTKRMMPWVIKTHAMIETADIVHVVDVFPNDMIIDLIDHMKPSFSPELLEKFIDRAMKDSDDGVLIHFLNKYEGPFPNDLSIKKSIYLRDLLVKIDHPRDGEIEEIRKLKKQKLEHENEWDQIQKQIEKMPKLTEESRLIQERIEQVLLSCPVRVRELIFNKIYST